MIIARSTTPAINPPAITPVFDVGLVVWLEKGGALVEPIEVKNESVCEGILRRLDEELAELVLGTVDSLITGALDDGGFDEVPGKRMAEISCEIVERMFKDGAEEVPGDIAEATLEVTLGSCVWSPVTIGLPALAHIESTKL